MKNIVSSIAFLAISLSVFSQTPKGFEWINFHGDDFPNPVEKAEDISVDRFGNIYVAGQVNDLWVRDSNGMIINSQQPPFLDSLYNYGGSDIWLAKYDPQGNLLWHRYAGGGADDFYFDMVNDPNGNCYISGRIRNHLYRAPHSFSRSPLSDNELGSFLAKVDANGNLIWHKSLGGDTIGGNYYEYGAGIEHLQLNNGIISAFLSGGGGHPAGFQKLFDRDSIVRGYHEAKFDLNGNYLGVKTFPFPVETRTPQIWSIQSNEKGVLISGVLNRDTTYVGQDTLIKSGLNNACVLAFDTNLNHINSFYGTNSLDQILDAKLIGDTLVASIHYDLRTVSSVTFDTITHQASPNARQESAIMLFNISGDFLGMYHSKSQGNHKANTTSAYIDNNSMGIGGSFDYKLTYSGGSNYIEAVDNCVNCLNSDLFFALLDRTGNLIAEDVIYTSGYRLSTVFSMARNDSMLYIGGIVSDSVIIPQVDTFITRGENDAFVAAYNLGITTSIEENSNYIKAENGILAYPNPTQGVVSLMGKPLSKEGQLFNLSGQLVKSFRLDQKAFRQTLDLQGLDKGVYLLMIVGPEGKQQLKLVKE